MSTQIQFSSPLLRKFTHADTTIGTAIVTLLAAADVSEKRISTTVQNKSAETIQVIFNDTSTVGLQVLPQQSIQLDNYQGIIRVKSTGAGTVVHLANASI